MSKKKVTSDASSPLPSERPAIGETVQITSGPLKGCKGYVIDTKPKTREMKYRKIIVSIEVDTCSGGQPDRITVQLSRDMLVDRNGNPLPDYSTQRDLEIMEERKAQYKRLKAAMEEHGCDPYDYFHCALRMSQEDIDRLERGEDCLDSCLDEDDCEELGFGLEWLLYGDEQNKVHPCGRQMKEYLNEHPEKREIVWKWMQEDQYPISPESPVPHRSGSRS